MAGGAKETTKELPAFKHADHASGQLLGASFPGLRKNR